MMKKIKIFTLLICILLILSGCTVKSEVTMNYDGSVRESVSVLANSKIFESDKYTKEQMIDSVVQNYSKILNFKKYEYDYVIGDELSGANVFKTYNNVCEYFENSAFNQYVYKYFDCTENSYYYEVKNATDYIPYCSDCSDWPALDDIELRITLPITAAEQNADEIEGNTYIWKYDKNTSSDKTFYLKINKESLKKYEENYLEEKEQKEQTKKIIIFSVIVIAIILLVIIGIVFYRKYKKNKLDY